MAAQIFAIDVHNTDGGELVEISDEGGHERDVIERLDRLEKTLEKALNLNAEAELEGLHVEEIAAGEEK